MAGGDAGHLAAELARAGRWMIAFGLAGVLGCYVCMWRSAVPLRWAVLGCVLAVGYVLTAYWILPAAPRAEEWAWVPVIAASGLALLAVPVFFRRAVVVTAEETLAAFALAILALLVAAAPMAWRHAPLTAAWAALLPLTAVAAWRLRVPGLLIGFVSLCALLICRAFLILPLFDGVDGRTLFWNPVVWAYGSLLVATALSAVIVERIGAVPVRLRGVIPPMGAVSSFLQACATTAAFMLFTLLVHWHYHNGRLDDITALLLERGTFVIGWLILAAVLLWLGDRLKRAMLVMAGQVVGVVALVFSVAILVLFANPLWSGDVLGSGLFLNELLLVYGMPAALCAVVAVLIESIPGANRGVGKAAGVVGFLLLFMLVTLQIRHGYAGEGMHSVVPTFTEWSTYTVAWMGLGIASLAIGLRFGRELPQKAGTILVTLGLLYVMIVPGFLMNPVFHAEAVGPVPVFNLLLYGYGVPIVLAAVAGVVIHPRMARFLGPALNGSPYVLLDLTLGGLIRAGICILVFILLTTEIRQYFQGTWLNGDAMTFVERATYPIAWFALAGVFLAVARRVGSEAARVASSVVAYIAIGTVLLVVTLMMNPLVTRESVGGTLIFNGLLYAYGIPAAATAGLAIFFWKRPGSSAARAGERVLAWVSAIASLLLIFTLVTLEVQHLFRGDHLRFSPGPPGEFTAYSLAWCVLGAVYLVTGIFARSALLRWASLLMLSLTILKVFLMDMADLKDFERVLSFGGLGLSLMALAFIYQRFVFRRPQAALAGDSLSAEAGASDLENQDPDGAL